MHVNPSWINIKITVLGKNSETQTHTHTVPYDHVPCQLLCSQVHHDQRSRGLTPNRPEPRLRSDPDAHGRPALTPFFRAGLPMAWGSLCSPGVSQRPRALLSADGGPSETSEEPPGSHLSQCTAALKRQDAGRGRTTGFRASGRFQGSSWTLKCSSNHKGPSGPGRGVRERPGGLVSGCCEATPPARGGSDPGRPALLLSFMCSPRAISLRASGAWRLQRRPSGQVPARVGSRGAGHASGTPSSIQSTEQLHGGPPAAKSTGSCGSGLSSE